MDPVIMRMMLSKQASQNRSRIVNNIDVSLNEDNFDPIHYLNGNGKCETLTGLPGPKSNKKTPMIEWQSKFPNLSKRQLRTDPVLSLRGSVCNDVWDILEDTDYRSTNMCCEYYSRCFCQVPSSPFLKMSYFTSKDETPPADKLEIK